MVLISKKQTRNGSEKLLEVLLVDDAEAIRLLILNYLAIRNYKIDTAINGLEAFERCKRNRYDIIVMDVQMPMMSGLEAVAKIRSIDDLYSAIPIIALTAEVDHDKIQSCLHEGYSEYLQKPIRKVQLLQLLDRYNSLATLIDKN